MKAIGYIRVSTDHQVKSGLSIQAQEKQIRSYCELYNIKLVSIIKDEGLSAKTLRRAGLQRVLSLLGTSADALIVAKLDRLTRSVKDLGSLIDDYFSTYSLVSVNEKIDTSSATGRMVLNVLASVSQWEREVIAERIVVALQVKKSTGYKLGQAPFGYSNVDGLLVENEKEQEILSEIATLQAKGYCYNAIATELNRRGYATRRNKQWTRGNLYSMLRKVG